ncbi:Uncharacterised protein [Neisseria meningitidis]|nr:Uncharacterised protein [Neisseria meningitidis]CWQ88910.1 Uncharacterised protein [Neisseria meningitidis]
MEKLFEAFNIGTRHIGIVSRRVCGEIQTEHTAHAVGGELDARRIRCRPKTLNQLFGTRRQVFIEAFALDDFQRFQACGDSNRVARQGACLIHAAQRGNTFHNVFAPAKRGKRHTAADDFAHRGQVGRDAVQRLRAAERDAEAGHHFVVNQHRAVFFGQSAQGFDKGFGRADEVHIADEGFDNHAGDFIAALSKGFFELGDIVVLEYQSVFGKVGRHTGGRRVAKRQQTAAGFHQQAVGMPVVAAFKLDDFVTPGKTACQTDGGHGRFGTGADEAQPFDGRHDFGDFFGNDDFAFGRRAERQTAQCGFAYGFDDFGVRVSDNRRSPRADVIGIARAVFVPNIRAFGFFDKARYAADAAECADGGIHAAGDDGFGAVE